MTAFLIVLALWLTPTALIVAWVAADRCLARRATLPGNLGEPRPPLHQRVPSQTPLYDAIALDFAARDLTDESLARAVEGWSR